MTLTSSAPRAPRRPRGRLVASVAIVAAAVAAVSTASAAPTSAVINACMSRSTGIVRVISATGTCGPNEVRFEWNQTGPPGPPGQPGQPGQPGPPGPPGPAGGASIIGGSSDVLPNAPSSTSYVAPFESGHSATEATVAQVLPVAGTLANLHADTEVDPGTLLCIGATCQANQWTLVVVRNGVETSMVCQIFGSTIYAARQPCSQTSATVAFAAGDKLSIAVKVGSFDAPAASALHWTASFTPA